MNGSPRSDTVSPWRRRAGLWIPALVLFLVALAALVVYPLRYAGRTEVTQDELAAARRVLADLEARVERVESRRDDLANTRSALEELYEERLSPESTRLTRVIAEVKELASRAGLEPQRISYPTEPLEDYGLRKRSFVFAVNGTYADLRTFINLLELSDSFLTLESVSLSGSSGPGGLNIQLRLSTLFSVDGAAPLDGAGGGGQS